MQGRIAINVKVNEINIKDDYPSIPSIPIIYTEC